VARQHEADIRLLGRAVSRVADVAVCITTLRQATRWAKALELRRGWQTAGWSSALVESGP
jgi:hypothetical protein